MCAAGAFRGVSGIDDGDSASRPAEYERCAQTGCAAADDDHVIGLGFHGLDGARARSRPQRFVAVSGNRH